MYCRYNFRTFWIFLTLIDLENKGTCVVVYRVRLEAKDFDMDWNYVKYRAENISRILKGVQ